MAIPSKQPSTLDVRQHGPMTCNGPKGIPTRFFRLRSAGANADDGYEVALSTCTGGPLVTLVVPPIIRRVKDGASTGIIDIGLGVEPKTPTELNDWIGRSGGRARRKQIYPKWTT